MTVGTSRRIGRWVLIGLAGVIGLVLLVRVGAGLYLRTSAGRTAVAKQLTSMIGLPVEVADVELGPQTSSVKFRVLDPAGGSTPIEILSVESASADVTLTDLVTGRTEPKELDLRGVSLTLRIDANGKILTTLPQQTAESKTGGPLPRINVENGQVTIRQEGRPEFSLRGLSLKAEPTGDKVVLNGSIDDPGWGKWKISGEVNRTSKTGWVDLATDDGPLAVDRLSSIPYVPLSIWQNARPDGRGAATVRLAVGPREEFTYDVKVQPKSAALHVPAADVTLTDVTGTIHAHDTTFELLGCKGKVAGGTIGVSGSAQLKPDRPEPSVAKFTVTADGLDVNKVPPEWGLTKEFGGQLRGKATIGLTIYPDGRIEPSGSGRGELVGATVLGFPAEITVRLHAENGKLKLKEEQSPAKPPGAQLPGSAAILAAAIKGGQDGGAPEIRLVTALLACGATVEFQPPKPDPARTDQSVLDATIKLKDIDIGQLLDKLQVKLPYKIGGKVSVSVAVAVPLGQAATRAAYKFTGTVTSPELLLEGLTIRDLSAAVDYQNGKLTLTALKGTIPATGTDTGAPGTFTGTATAQVEPAGDLAANLALDRIPLGEVLKAIPNWSIETRGRVTGKAEFKAPFEKLADPGTWTATAGVSSDDLIVAGRHAKGVRLGLAVANGTATLKDAAATVEGIPVTASATLALTDKYKFDAAVKTTGTDVTDLRKLVPEAELPVPVEGVLETDSRVSGTLSPFTYTASGTVKASKLTLNKTPANHVALKWELTPDRVALSDLKADVFGGTISGSADYPFNPKKAGAFNLAFKDVDAAAATAFVPDFPVKITGSVSGKVAGTIPPAESKQGRVGNLDVDLSAPKLTVQGIPAERLAGKATVKDGAIDYALEGKSLGGSFEIKGRYPGQGKKPAKKDDRGSLRITDIDLSRLAPELRLQSLAPLRGRVDVTFDYENDLSAGSGRLIVRGLAWGDNVARPELVGVLLLREGFLELEDLSGTLGGGQIRGRARVRLNDPSRNHFVLSLARADAKRLFAPIPELDAVVGGDISVVVHGSVHRGREMHGSGTVSIARGTVGGVAVSELRVPFTYATSPGGYGRLTIHEASTHAGSGQARGSVTVEWGTGGGARVDGQVLFTNVPLRAISPNLGENGLFGNGHLTGRFDLSGTNVKSADDLNGTLIATLNNTSVKEVPFLQHAVPYLNPAGLAKPFGAGDIRANLSRGVFRVQRLALANPTAQLFADGTITTTGRLDLNVVAHTGQIGPNARGLQLLGLRLPAFGPVPLTLIRDVSTFFSNRTVRLTITGTTSAPVVRVNTAALLTEEAVRFFLTRYVVPPGLVDAFGIGSAGLIGGEMKK